MRNKQTAFRVYKGPTQVYASDADNNENFPEQIKLNDGSDARNIDKYRVA